LYTHESELSFAVYAYATSVLARTRPAATPRGGAMTREEAERLVRSLLDAHGARGAAPVFGAGDAAGVMLGAAELFFEYEPEARALACGALVYRFRDEPRPGVLEGFLEEEKRGARADAGGGALVYREKTRALLLGRTYTDAVPGDEFARDMKRLAEASLRWADEVAERVASRVRSREGPGAGRNH
jgi:hypothetical protein